MSKAFVQLKWWQGHCGMKEFSYCGVFSWREDLIVLLELATWLGYSPYNKIKQNFWSFFVHFYGG